MALGLAGGRGARVRGGPARALPGQPRRVPRGRPAGRAPAGRPHPPRPGRRPRHHRADGGRGHRRGGALPAPGRRPARRDLRGPHHPGGDRLRAGGRSGPTRTTWPQLRHFAEARAGRPGRDPRELHALVAAISRNAGLELFVDVFNRVAQLYSPDWQRFGSAVAEETAHAHARIAEAVMAGDAGLARSRMRKHLRGRGRLLPPPPLDPPAAPGLGGARPQSAQGKGAEAVARSITQTIVTEGLQPGRARRDRARADRARGCQPRRSCARRSGCSSTTRSPACAAGPGGGLFVDGAERRRRHRGGGHLPGPARHAAGRAGRAAHRRRGRDHRPGGRAHRRRGRRAAARGARSARSTPPTPSGPRPCTICTRPWRPRRTTGCWSWSPWC